MAIIFTPKKHYISMQLRVNQPQQVVNQVSLFYKELVPYLYQDFSVPLIQACQKIPTVIVSMNLFWVKPSAPMKMTLELFVKVSNLLHCVLHNKHTSVIIHQGRRSRSG